MSQGFNFDFLDSAIGAVTEGFVDVVGYLGEGLDAASQLRDKRDSLRVSKAAANQQTQLVTAAPQSNDFVTPEPVSKVIPNTVASAQQKEQADQTPKAAGIFSGNSGLVWLALGVAAFFVVK